MHDSFALSPRLVLGRGEEASCGSAAPDEAGELPEESRPEGCADDCGQLVATPVSGWGACLMRSCDEERAARASVGLGNWEKGLDRQLGPVDEPWVEEFDESPGEGAPSRRLTEQGTPSTLESSLTSSASASSGEIGERTMGAVCSRSVLTYCRRRSASRPRSRDSEGGGTASEGCVGSSGSTDESHEESLLTAGEGVAADWPAPSAGASAVGLLRCVVQLAGHGCGSL